MKLKQVLLTFLLVSATAQADPLYWNYRKLQKQRNILKMKVEGVHLEEGELNPEMSVGWFDQLVDHFTLSRKSKTFKQRYFVDSSQAKGPNAPVFFYICGESACGGPNEDEVNFLAKKYRGHKVALEHRYYGESQPFKDLSNEHLRYLTMEQAIEDLAYFQQYAQSILHLDGKWISMGGSYPGSLSAFYRMKHPEMVVGALASSAPVYAKANFFEYDHHVAKVAGPKCLSIIQKVNEDLENKLKDEKSAKAVKKIFQAEKIKDNVDFLYVVADMGAAAIQYGFQEEFCKTLEIGERTGKATEAYATAGVRVFSQLQTSAFRDSFQAAQSLNPKNWLRSWMYQSCTEFGYFQTAHLNPAKSARSQQVTLDYHYNVCKRLFDLEKPVDTEQTNRNFYEKLFQARTTNIHFTNGSNDPWSILSITDPSAIASNASLSLFVLSGASHCEDLGAATNAVIEQAHGIFSKLVGRWLSE